MAARIGGGQARVRLRHIGIACTAVAMLAACGRTPANERLALERQGCWGTCPAYRVEVDGRGAVSFYGRNFVDSAGAAAWRVAPESAAVLVAEFRRGRDSYRARHPGGPTRCLKREVFEGGYFITLREASGAVDSLDRYTECGDLGQYTFSAFADHVDTALGTGGRVGRYAVPLSP